VGLSIGWYPTVENVVAVCSWWSLQIPHWQIFLDRSGQVRGVARGWSLGWSRGLLGAVSKPYGKAVLECGCSVGWFGKCFQGLCKIEVGCGLVISHDVISVWWEGESKKKERNLIANIVICFFSTIDDVYTFESDYWDDGLIYVNRVIIIVWVGSVGSGNSHVFCISAIFEVHCTFGICTLHCYQCQNLYAYFVTFVWNSFLKVFFSCKLCFWRCVW